MQLLTTGQVRRLFDPPLPEHVIRNRIRSGAIEPEVRAGGQFLWSPSEVQRLAELLDLPVPSLVEEGQ